MADFDLPSYDLIVRNAKIVTEDNGDTWSYIRHNTDYQNRDQRPAGSLPLTERTQEIGERKALGAKYRAILSQFLMESATICLLGGLLALGLAWGATMVAKQWLPVRISPTIATLARSVSALT